ncbi:MAG: nitroreductase [Fusobacteriaceae bacterium]|jgi:nitroreductase|nr:nitroreductase [Fusobacteriaceae bacterium]
MNQVIENILKRRSIRKFIEKPIEKEKLDAILKAAAYAPSGKNLQTWQFTAIVNRKKLEIFYKIIGKVLEREDYDFYNAEAIIITSNIKDGNWSKEDNACALENIFLAATSLGVGSVWLNQLQTISDAPDIRKLLNEYGIPKEHDVYGIAAIGYPQNPGTFDKEVTKKGVIKIIE